MNETLLPGPFRAAREDRPAKVCGREYAVDRKTAQLQYPAPNPAKLCFKPR